MYVRRNSVCEGLRGAAGNAEVGTMVLMKGRFTEEKLRSGERMIVEAE
jgi:hypothetical protein